MWTAVLARQADKASQLFGDVLPWLLALIGLTIVGGVIILAFRRYMSHEPTASRPGFTLHDLRELHARGELTDDEFERAKAQMIGRVAAPRTPDSNREKPPSPGNREESSP